MPHSANATFKDDDQERNPSVMNAMNYQATKNYQKVQVESASPEKLVLMLYDGAVRKLGQAEVSLQSDRVEEFHEHVVRVQKIITELLGALDTSKGGDLAENLGRLYDYMLRQLSLSLVRRSVEQVVEIKGLLEELRQGWQGVVQQQMGPDSEVIVEEPRESKPAVRGFPYPGQANPVSTLNISG